MRNTFLFGTVAAAFLLSVGVAGAQGTWDGGGLPDGNFTQPLNWITDVAPAGNGAYFFDGSINLNATNNMTLTAADNSFTFNAGASAFTIWGGNLRIGTITNNSAFLQTFNDTLQFNGNRTLNVGSAGLQLLHPAGSFGSLHTVTKIGTGDLIVGSGVNNNGGMAYTVNAGRLLFNGSTTTSLGTNNISAGAGVALNASGTTLQFNNSGTLTMGGSITTVAGSSVILNNSGTTRITNGTTIALGASLSGTGNLQGGAVTLNGNISPGIGGIGTISPFNLLMGVTATNFMEIDRSAGQNADLIAASGTLDYGGSTLVVTNTGASLLAGDTFNLFDGTISGVFGSTNLPTLDSGLAWDTSLLNSQGIISVMALVVPEPSSIALVGMGVTALMVRQIRRRNIG